MNYPHPLLAKEGWPFIAIALVLAVAASVFAPAWLAGLAWLLLVFVVQFFRDPPREIPAQADAVLSPADGRIVKIEKVRDPYAERDALLISVFMNVFNVHSNRSGVNGLIKKVTYFPGLFVNADLDKASLENERNAVVIESGGQLITQVQVAGLIARRIICYVTPGDVVKLGQRIGLIKFGSRTELIVPADRFEPVVVTSPYTSMWPT